MAEIWILRLYKLQVKVLQRKQKAITEQKANTPKHPKQ